MAFNNLDWLIHILWFVVPGHYSGLSRVTVDLVGRVVVHKPQGQWFNSQFP